LSARDTPAGAIVAVALLEQSFSYCNKAATANVYAPKKHQSARPRVTCFGFLKLEFGISLDVGAWDLELA
jgi:hypothetical protein